MSAQYPGIGFPPDSQVNLLRKLVNNTADMVANGTPIAWVAAPVTSASAGTAGQVAYDADYLYVAVSANTWRRVAISDWA